MRHAFSFPLEVRNAVRAFVDEAVNKVSGKSFRQEPSYVAALMGRLVGIAYEGPYGFVELKPVIVDSQTTEPWFGADFAITADIRSGELAVQKAIVAQAKRGSLAELPKGERERLIGQVRQMRNYTRSPKVMLIPESDGERRPAMISGVRLVGGFGSKPVGLSDYFVRRVLPTLDGDTRPGFVEAVQESRLTQVRVLARLGATS